MSVFEQNFDGKTKIDIAIQRIKHFEVENYHLAFSGGKDSVVIKRLADMSGVKYKSFYALTTVDPPELVKFIREEYPDVVFDKPKLTMWQLIPKRGMPPTRIVRYCCEYLKESKKLKGHLITGIRKQESSKRSKRKIFEQCYKQKGKHYVNPIIDWSDQEVWEFIRAEKIPYCKLYDEGFKRLGCVGCPMATNQKEELERWPKYKRAYIKAFDRMIANRLKKGKNCNWKTGEEVMDWWVNNRPKISEGQENFIFMDNESW